MGEINDVVTIRKELLFGGVIAVLAVLLVVSIFTKGFGIMPGSSVTCPTPTVCPPQQNCTTAGAQNQTNTGQGQQAAEISVMEAPATLSTAPLMGAATSGVTVLEFTDFQCPFCGMVWGSSWANDYASRYGPIIGTVPKLETEYVKTNKVNLRHFPVAFLGEESNYASVAALCAKQQGKYWEMHDAIFGAQTPQENSGKYSKDNLLLLAKNITGLDQAAFTTCLQTDATLTQVQAFTDDWNAVSAANMGRAGTPTFFILVDASKVTKAKVTSAATAAGFDWAPTSDNSQYVVVASPEYSKLKQFIDGVLN